MSSPLGNISPHFFQRALIKLHKKTSHSHRVKTLSEIIYRDFLLPFYNEKDDLKVLDIGCGDMQIIYELKNKLPEYLFKGIDVFKLPENFVSDAYWQNYACFDGINIPFEDNYFDVVLLIDVLHHIQVEKQLPLLTEIKRVAKFVIIKDHFEYGFFSRQMLRLMDLAGNWAYGVRIPKKYFTKTSFASFLSIANCKKIKMIEGINLYQHLKPLNFIMQDNWQFIYFGKLN